MISVFVSRVPSINSGKSPMRACRCVVVMVFQTTAVVEGFLELFVGGLGLCVQVPGVRENEVSLEQVCELTAAPGTHLTFLVSNGRCRVSYGGSCIPVIQGSLVSWALADSYRKPKPSFCDARPLSRAFRAYAHGLLCQ